MESILCIDISILLFAYTRNFGTIAFNVNILERYQKEMRNHPHNAHVERRETTTKNKQKKHPKTNQDEDQKNLV